MLNHNNNNNSLVSDVKKNIILVFLLILFTPLYSQHEGIRRYFNEYNYNVYPYETFSYYNDTLLTGFHRFSAKQSEFIFTPGEIGAPKFPMIFSNRNGHSDFVFFDYYLPYIFTHESTNFFDTKTPFTIIRFNGGAKETDDIRVMHTQNVNPSFNFGADYRTCNSTGHYQQLKSKTIAINLFASYTKHRYQAHGDFIFNKLNHFNNGGIQNDSLFEKTELRPENISVNMTNSSTTLAQTGFQYRHSLNFGPAHYDTIVENKDTLVVKGFNGRAAIEQMISFDRYFRLYNDIPSAYYENIYIDSLQTHDSISLRKLKHELMFKLRLSDYSNPNLSYVAASLVSDFDWYHQYNADVFYLNHGIKLMYRQSFANYQLYSNATTYIMGHDAGDIWANFGAVAGINKESKHSVSVNFKYSLQEFDFWEEHYFSNHFIWDNEHAKETEAALNAEYNFKPWKIYMGVDLYLLKDYLIYNYAAKPEFVNETNQIFSARIGKRFNLKPFYWDNTFYYQYVSHIDKLPVPKLSGNSNMYFQHYLFDNNLLLQIGLDFWYHSEVFGPAYMPATGVFYLQNQRKTGNYFLLDAYASFKVKRLRAFFRMGNVSDTFMPRNYFNMLHYPDRPMAFNFGISWEFYD
jgi:hypothetical protein